MLRITRERGTQEDYMVNDPVNWEKEYPVIRKMIEDGTSLSFIAKVYGVSRQRVHQIMDKYGKVKVHNHKDMK